MAIEPSGRAYAYISDDMGCSLHSEPLDGRLVACFRQVMPGRMHSEERNESPALRIREMGGAMWDVGSLGWGFWGVGLR